MFKGRHFDRSVILLCIRWYLAYDLSLRDLEEMMADVGFGRPCDDPSMGCPVLTPLLQAFQCTQAGRYRYVECRRDLYQG